MRGVRERLRVATYNLYLGTDLSLLLGDRSPDELSVNRAEVQRQLVATAFPERVQALAGALAGDGARPDLVGLQEVCTWEADGRPLWDFAELLLQALEERGVPYEQVATQPSFHGQGEVLVDGRSTTLRLSGSNTILRRRDSRVRVEATRSGLFPTALRLPLEGVEISIDRGWCEARCTVDGQPGSAFRFVATHTEAYEAGSRGQQRDELLALLAEEPGAIVVVGDLNAEPQEVGMPADFVDAWTAAGRASEGPDAATCCQAGDLANPDSGLTKRIDYVFVRGLEPVDAWHIGVDPAARTAGGLWPSDHAGVVAELVTEE